MNLFALPAALLFALSIPVVMQYRILPIEGTPYWLFGILFFSLIGKILLDMYPELCSKLNRTLSTFLLIVVLCIVLGGSLATAIADRHRIAPVWGTHDIILQLEAAMRYLIQGKNPYKETYFGTPVEMFRYDEMGKEAVNPALYHFVMPPWYLLAPFPVYLIANRTVGYFDGRMLSALIMIGTLILLWMMIKDKVLKEIAVILTALSPATVDYFIEGRSDPFAFFWVLLSLYLLQIKQPILSALMMGLGLVSKQTIWFAFPVWSLLLLKNNASFQLRQSVISLFRKPIPVKDLMYNSKYVIIAIATALIFMVPFLLWDAGAFLESVVFYLSAGGETGYPVSGYGFSMVLFSLGIIQGLREYFPFTVYQLGLGLPILALTSLWMLKKPSISRFLIVYGGFLFVVWYFSRYFNNSHVAYLSTLFTLAIIFHYDEQMAVKGKQTK